MAQRRILFLFVLSLISSCVAAAPQLSAVDFMGGTKTVSIEQQYENAEEGSVVWDASRSLLAHVSRLSQKSADANLITGRRVLEIGSGTGVVGLALAQLGASSVVMTDKASQIPLMLRNVEHNQPSCCADRCVLCKDDVARVSVLPLTWGSEWQSECDPSLCQLGAWDTIICCE